MKFRQKCGVKPECFSACSAQKTAAEGSTRQAVRGPHLLRLCSIRARSATLYPLPNNSNTAFTTSAENFSNRTPVVCEDNDLNRNHEVYSFLLQCDRSVDTCACNATVYLQVRPHYSVTPFKTTSGFTAVLHWCFVRVEPQPL